MYGKKFLIPLFYDYSYTYRNNYSSKSEKNRHETLLNEISKLQFYLQQNPDEELLILKDFLQKFNINNISDYSDKKLLYICKLLCKTKQNDLLYLVKPDSNIKKMLYNLLNISFDIKKKENNNGDTIYYPQKNFRKIYFKKSKTSDKHRYNSRKRLLNIYDTNSKLKFIDKQKELYKPNKNYSNNYDLMFNEVKKEIKEIEKNLKKSRDIKNHTKIKNNNNIFITQTKNRALSSYNIIKNNLMLTPIMQHKENKEENKLKGFFLIFPNNLVNKNKMNEKSLNVCFKKKIEKMKCSKKMIKWLV